MQRVQGRGEGRRVGRGPGQGFTTPDGRHLSTSLPPAGWAVILGGTLPGWRLREGVRPRWTRRWTQGVGPTTPYPPRSLWEGPVPPAGGVRAGQALALPHPDGPGTEESRPEWVGFSPTDFPEWAPGWGGCGQGTGWGFQRGVSLAGRQAASCSACSTPQVTFHLGDGELPQAGTARPSVPFK